MADHVSRRHEAFCLIFYAVLLLITLSTIAATYTNHPLFPPQLDSLTWSNAWLLASVIYYYGAILCFCGVVVASEVSWCTAIPWMIACCTVGSPACCLYVFLWLTKEGGTLRLERGSTCSTLPLQEQQHQLQQQRQQQQKQQPQSPHSPTNRHSHTSTKSSCSTCHKTIVKDLDYDTDDTESRQPSAVTKTTNTTYASSTQQQSPRHHHQHHQHHNMKQQSRYHHHNHHKHHHHHNHHQNQNQMPPHLYRHYNHHHHNHHRHHQDDRDVERAIIS